MALAIMRRHKRWLYGFLWVVIAAFIILYIPAFRGADAGSPAEAVARVGGLPVTATELRRAYMDRRQLYERLYQGRLDRAALANLGLEEQALQGLVDQRVMELEAQRLGLTVSDEALAHALSTSPRFQRDGAFVGATEIRRLLELQGMTVEQFEAELRRDLMRERLEQTVTDGVLVAPAEVEAEYRKRNQQVKIEYVQVDAARFRPEIAADAATLQAHFAAHREDFRAPERRIVEYVLVAPEAMRSRVTITESDILGYYNSHREDFREEAQVCASHILVKVKSDPAATEGHTEDEARALAQKLLEQVHAGGDFAELAKKSSEDLGSAARSGDLGCFGRGRMVPEFENAAFSLTAGQTSDLVKSNFGYHIIRVASVKEEAVPPLAQVKERIRQTLQDERAQTLAAEKSAAVATALSARKDFAETAKAQGLEVQKSAPFDRQAPPEALASPRLSTRAFELKANEVEPLPIRVAKGEVFIRLVEVQPSRLPDFAEVEAKVRDAVQDHGARERAKALAADLRQRAEKDGLEKAATALGLVRKETPSPVGRGAGLGELGSSLALDEAVFALAPQVLSEPLAAAAGFAVVRVLEKKDVDPAAFEKEKASVADSLKQERRRRLFDAFLRQARERYAVERDAAAFRRVVAS